MVELVSLRPARKGDGEALFDAEGFYRKHGFRTVKRGYFSHGLGGDPIEIVHMELSP